MRNMEATKSYNILILWLLAAATAILLMSAIWSAMTHTTTRTIQWQSDTSWVKGW